MKPFIAIQPMAVYHPKGGMCLGCTWLDADCSRLDFKSMPVIESHPGEVIVKCTQHKPRINQ